MLSSSDLLLRISETQTQVTGSVIIMAEKQDERDSAGADITVTGSTDAERDEELDALLNSKNSMTNVTSMAAQLAL